jgi:hypothetical protein
MPRALPLLALLGLCAISPLRAEALAAGDVLDQCRVNPNAASATGLKALSAVCPDLAPALAALKFSGLLHADWRENLDRKQLDDLGLLWRRYQPPAPSLRPAPEALRTIARSLPTIDEASRSWWRRFKEALQRWLAGSGDAASNSWLRWLPHWSINPTLQEVLLYGLMLSVVLLAATLIALELRASGVLAGLRGQRGPRSGATESVPHAQPARSLSFADVEAAPAAERPALVLRLLVESLTRSRRLTAERSLTHRELSERAAFDSEPQRARFKRLALLAEGSLYGARPTTLATPDLSDARELHDELLVARVT